MLKKWEYAIVWHLFSAVLSVSIQFAFFVSHAFSFIFVKMKTLGKWCLWFVARRIFFCDVWLQRKTLGQHNRQKMYAQYVFQVKWKNSNLNLQWVLHNSNSWGPQKMFELYGMSSQKLFFEWGNEEKVWESYTSYAIIRVITVRDMRYFEL